MRERELERTYCPSVHNHTISYAAKKAVLVRETLLGSGNSGCDYGLQESTFGRQQTNCSPSNSGRRYADQLGSATETTELRCTVRPTFFSNYSKYHEQTLKRGSRHYREYTCRCPRTPAQAWAHP